MGVILSGTLAEFQIKLPVPLRSNVTSYYSMAGSANWPGTVNQSATTSLSVMYAYTGAANIGYSSFSGQNYQSTSTSTTVNFLLGGGGTGTAGQACIIYMPSSAGNYLGISAEF